MAGKTVRLPKGHKRADIVEKSKEQYFREFDYDKLLEADFNDNRAAYTEVMLYGVPVKVKVKQK